MRQIDISCVQAFHTMDEIDAMVELAKKYRLAARSEEHTSELQSHA